MQVINLSQFSKSQSPQIGSYLRFLNANGGQEITRLRLNPLKSGPTFG